MVTILPVKIRSPDPFLPSYCYQHTNIARTYGITCVDSRSVLMIEKVETSLTNLLKTFGNDMNLRERADLALGVVSAVDYLHHSHEVAHGRLSTDTVFFTSRLSARVLDPAAALIVSSGYRSTSLRDDIEQLQRILISLFSTDNAADVVSCKQMLVHVRRFVDESTSESVVYRMLQYLDGIRSTKEYLDCSPTRLFSCPLYRHY